MLPFPWQNKWPSMGTVRLNSAKGIKCFHHMSALWRSGKDESIPHICFHICPPQHHLYRKSLFTFHCLNYELNSAYHCRKKYRIFYFLIFLWREKQCKVSKWKKQKRKATTTNCPLQGRHSWGNTPVGRHSWMRVALSPFSFHAHPPHLAHGSADRWTAGVATRWSW